MTRWTSCSLTKSQVQACRTGFWRSAVVFWEKGKQFAICSEMEVAEIPCFERDKAQPSGVVSDLVTVEIGQQPTFQWRCPIFKHKERIGFRRALPSQKFIAARFRPQAAGCPTHSQVSQLRKRESLCLLAKLAPKKLQSPLMPVRHMCSGL